MAITVSPRQLVRESLPIFGIVLLWAIPAALLQHGAVTTGLQAAGVVMALLYAGVRGYRLAGTVPVHGPVIEPAALLRTNLVALGGAGVWFLLALVADASGGFATLGGTIVTSPLAALEFASAATGVVTVVLYAVVVGVTILDHDRAGSPHRDPSGTFADD